MKRLHAASLSEEQRVQLRTKQFNRKTEKVLENQTEKQELDEETTKFT